MGDSDNDILVRIVTEYQAGGMDAARRAWRDHNDAVRQGKGEVADFDRTAARLGGRTLGQVQGALHGNVGAIVNLARNFKALGGIVTGAGAALLAFGVGWKVGRWIDDTFKLSQKFADLVAPVEKVRSIASQIDPALRNLTKIELKRVADQFEAMASAAERLNKSAETARAREEAVGSAANAAEIAAVEAEPDSPDKARKLAALRKQGAMAGITAKRKELLEKASLLARQEDQSRAEEMALILEMQRAEEEEAAVPSRPSLSVARLRRQRELRMRADAARAKVGAYRGKRIAQLSAAEEMRADLETQAQVLSKQESEIESTYGGEMAGISREEEKKATEARQAQAADVLAARVAAASSAFHGARTPAEALAAKKVLSSLQAEQLTGGVGTEAERMRLAETEREQRESLVSRFAEPAARRAAETSTRYGKEAGEAATAGEMVRRASGAKETTRARSDYTKELVEAEAARKDAEAANKVLIETLRAIGAQMSDLRTQVQNLPIK